MTEIEALISSNIEYIREKTAIAAAHSGRKENDVKLMAVTKFRSPEEIRAAYKAGIRLFGENRVQEALQKFGGGDLSFPDSSLHMIGNLQRNKVKSILPLVNCIHSVDRPELLEEIAKRLSCAQNADRAASRPLKLLLEIHTGEKTKSGFSTEDDTVRALEYAEKNNLCVCGFMTMAPLIHNSASEKEYREVRNSFIKLRKTAETMQKRFPSFTLTELSMGMSGDFEIAVEEGSTLIRIGTRLFCSRNAENSL